MIPVEGPQVPGAMMTPNGSYAVPVLDHQTYTQQKTPQVSVQEEKPEIPEDLLCSICTDLLTDAVMIPCCGNSFCDECIRSCLLESEDHECPDCHERDISPGTLIPNRFLRNSVTNFKSTTGYVKRPVYKPLVKEKTEQTDVTTEVRPLHFNNRFYASICYCNCRLTWRRKIPFKTPKARWRRKRKNLRPLNGKSRRTPRNLS